MRPESTIRRQPLEPRPFAGPVLAATALGAVFGFLYPATHVAIEPAQLLAGLVAYPPDNAFWLYETRVWTVLHQILALLLAIGIEERVLTQLVSAGVGALNFAAIAAFARALGAPPTWSTVTPFLLWALNPVGWGFGYPILLLGHPHTYGTVGLAWVVLACSVIGAGHVAIGAALLGFAPALHPSVGASMAGLTVLCALIGWSALRPELPALARGLAVGVALAALSAAIHLATLPPAPDPDPAAIARLYPVFIEQWDAHRQPLDASAWQGRLLGLGVATAVAWLVRARVTATQALLLRVFVACAVAGVCFALVRQLAPPGAIPNLLLSAMPTRILNFPMLAFLPLVVAATLRDGTSRVAQIAAALLAVLAFVWQRVPGIETWALSLLGLAALGEVVLRPHGGAPRLPRTFGYAVTALVGIGMSYVLVLGISGHPRRVAVILRDRTTDAALMEAARGSGLLAVAPGVDRAQLATRRPIVIDPQAIDMFTYVPAGLPGLARAIEGLYGIDFAAPLPRDRNHAVIPVATVKRIWERRTPEEWARVGREFDVQEVLVPAAWELQIPKAASSRAFALHRIDGLASAPEAGD